MQWSEIWQRRSIQEFLPLTRSLLVMSDVPYLISCNQPLTCVFQDPSKINQRLSFLFRTHKIFPVCRAKKWHMCASCRWPKLTVVTDRNHVAQRCTGPAALETGEPLHRASSDPSWSRRGLATKVYTFTQHISEMCYQDADIIHPAKTHSTGYAGGLIV